MNDVQPAPRVIHLVTALDCGGLERLVVEWANVRNRRHPGSTEVWCLDRPGVLAELVRGDAVRCFDADRGRWPWDRAAVRRLRRALHEAEGTAGPGVLVHSHNLAAQQYAVLACLWKRVRHVHTEHGSNPHVKGVVNAVRLRLLARLTTRLVAVSEDTARAIQPCWGVSRTRVSVIRNGVTRPPAAADKSACPSRADLGIPEEAFVIGYTGRLAKVKGVDRLLRAVARLGDRRVHVLVAGEGPERAALEDLAAELDVSPRVAFAGFRKEARQLLDIMDLFVLPSRGEGLSVSLLEAMAAGCPVAVTDAGESRAVVENGKAGRVLPADDAEWAAALRSCLTEQGRETSAQRAERAGERVRRHYSLEATLDAYESLYRATNSERGFQHVKRRRSSRVAE